MLGGAPAAPSTSPAPTRIDGAHAPMHRSPARWLALAAVLVTLAPAAQAAAAAAEPSEAEATAPTPSEEPGGMLSIADSRPELLYSTRRSTYVYGTPSTESERFLGSTQLTGDWGGLRRKAAERGVFFDLYSMTVPQGLVSGPEGSAVSQHFDMFLTLDSGRMGLWPGGQLHFSAHSKLGPSMNEKTASLVPVNTGRIFPILDDGDYIYPTGYYIVQGLHPKFGVTLGKLTTSSFADQNVFANQYRYQFQSAGMNNNPMLGQYSSPSTWAAMVLWRPLSWLTLSTGRHRSQRQRRQLRG